MTDKQPIQPSGVEVSITDTGSLIVDFKTDQIPPIRFSVAGAEQVGSHLNTAADRARKDGGWDD